MQAKYTDLIVFNKWEQVDEMSFERCLDRVGDLDVQTAWVKSRKGVVDLGVIVGIDGALVTQKEMELNRAVDDSDHGHNHGGAVHDHYDNHQDEVEVLSLILKAADGDDATGINLDDLEELLLSAPKDEVYRIKGMIASSAPPPDSSGERRPSLTTGVGIYILNWAFSRWTYTQLGSATNSALGQASARLTFILARGESFKWKKKLEAGELLRIQNGKESTIDVRKIG